MADKIKIDIATTADLSALQRLEADLKRQIETVKAAGQNYKQLEKDLSDVQAKMASMGNHEANDVISEFTKEIPGANTAIRALEGGLGTMAVALGGAFAAFEGAKKSIEAFGEAQLKVAELDAALANSGQFTEEYREKLQHLAEELQETTSIANEDWLGALTTLTKFGADESNIDKYTEAVKNLAGFLGGDLQTAAFLFGKAMQGSTTMLARYGIQVEESMSRTEKLDSIMQQVAARGAGQLEARAGTLAGSWKGLELATDDVFKSFGRLINNTGFLQDAMAILKAGLAVANEAMGGSITAADGLTNKIILQGQSADEAAQSLADYSAALDDVKGRSDEFATSLDSQTKVIDEKAAQVRDLTKAQKELALAQIEADSSLSKEDKIKARSDVEKKFAESDVNASIAAAKDKIAAREAAIQGLEETARQNRETLAEQRAKAEAAKKAEDEAQTQADSLNSIAEEKEKLQRELAAREKTQAKQASMGVMDSSAESDKAAMRREIAELDEKAAAIGKVNEEAKKSAEIEAANLKAAEAAIGDENKKNAALQSRLSAENEAEKSKSESRKQVAAVESQVADVRTKSAITSAKTEADAATAEIAAKKEKLRIQILINEARAAGNDQEADALQWIQRQNEEKEKGLSDDEATRAANAAAAVSGGRKYQSPADAGMPLGTKAGDLLAGTNFRRGRDQSDSSFAMSEADANMGGPGGSLLDAYNKTKGLPVGSVGGNNPTASTGKNGAEDVQKAAADLAKQSDNIKSAASTLAAAANSLNGDGLTTLKNAVATLTTQVQALINKV